MPESPDQSGGARIQWGRAMTAGLVATIVMTVVMALMSMNIVKMLGSMIAGSDASAATQYIAGGAMHFMIGIGYGVIYAALLSRVVEWNRVIKGTVYGLAIAAIALAAMPVMSSVMGGGKAGAQNPCAGSSGQAAAMNPCADKQAASAKNPCAGKQAAGTSNPCQGQPTATNPCHPSGAGNPCNPRGGGGPWGGVLSVINHLVYALTLAFVYGKVR